jgi:hypothetical protein
MFVVVISFAVLALTAVRWGHDSRPTLRSREWEQAALGLVWERNEVASGVETRSALATAMRVRRVDAELRATQPECRLVA